MVAARSFPLPYGSKGPMRVLHVVPSLRKDGGVERFVYNVAKESDPSAVCYDFLHQASPIGYRDAECFDDELRDMGCDVRKVSNAADDLFGFVRETKEFFAEYGSVYDFVHCHMPNLAFCVLRCARDTGVRHRILHSHLNASSDVFSHRVRNAPLIAIGKRYATERVACSEDAGRYLFGRKPFKVINNGIPVEDYRYSEDRSMSYRDDLGIPLKAKVVGCVGRFTPQKNFRFMIKVFSELLERDSNVYLVMVGDGPQKNEVMEAIQRYGITDNVRILGFRSDLNILYSLFDVFAMPSLYEGLPVAAVEAQAAGLRCVFSTGVPSDSDVRGDAKFISLDGGIATWVSALMDALDQDVDRGCPKRIETSYSSRAASIQLEAMYASIASGRKCG